ncbi:MAG TPA: hypothetical protein VEX15_13020 [Nocardioidaceae bacterium]|nr:hypothetical protein [Nocardioidaceae bacterium]
MRDLDELLDPVVSRRATAATHTPDFAAIERRGRQRRRRARAMAAGAVAAVAAAIAFTGTQVVQDSAAPEPVGHLRGFEGPDGELGRAIDSGDASVANKAWSADGSTLLTTWSVSLLDPDNPRSFAPAVGYTIQTGEQEGWSKVYRNEVFFVPSSPVADGVFAVGRRGELNLVSPGGIREMRVTKPPAPFADLDGDALVADWERYGGYLLIDVGAGHASEVKELSDVAPASCGTSASAALSNDGDLWALRHADGRYELVRTLPDGGSTSFVFANQAADPLASIIQYEGRVGVLWIATGGDLRVSVPNQSAGDVTTYNYPDVAKSGLTNAGCTFDAVVLPDGRLLIVGPSTLARSTDATWTRAETYPVPAELRKTTTGGLGAVGEEACAATYDPYDSREIDVPDPICSTDGLRWHTKPTAP